MTRERRTRERETAARGFGTSFVKRSVTCELNGTVDMSSEPDGFRAVIAFPSQESAAAE